MTVNVNSYTRQDGTKVTSHKRKDPNFPEMKYSKQDLPEKIIVKQPEDKEDYQGIFLKSLEKNKAKSFHLPIETAIYVPSTGKDQRKILGTEFNRRIKEVKRYLSLVYGGFSAVKIEGGYTTDDNQIVEEDIVKVVAFSTEETFKKNKNKIIRYLENLARKWHQESIGYEFEGDLHYISG